MLINILEKYKLQIIKIIHTIVWAFFVLCIMMVWVLGIFGSYKEALLPIVAILIEIVILIANGWTCPLTSFAAKYTNYTKAPKDNFDIYLPNWLAKYNMAIFGSLFVASIIFTFFRWISSLN